MVKFPIKNGTIMEQVIESGGLGIERTISIQSIDDLK